MNNHSCDEMDQDALMLAPSSHIKVQQPLARKHLFWLLVISGLVFWGCTLFTNQMDIPTGDEPHYLVISQTLWLYHSLDVTRDYAHQDYRAFYPGQLGPYQHISSNARGQLLPLHSIGAPIIWLLPFILAGRLGALLLISFVSLLIVANGYLLLLALGIRPPSAFLVSLGVALASPVWVYSHHTFVEPIAALLCTYVVRILFKAHLRPFDLLGCSVALGIFPWIHSRFALFTAILGGFLLLRIAQEKGEKRSTSWLYALGPVALLLLLLETYTVVVWGSLNPAINQVNAGELPFDVAPWRGLFGLFFDQEYGLLTNFPLFLLLLAGIILACHKRFLRFNVMVLLLSVPYILTIASFHNWDGATSPPARFLVVLVPLFAFYVALVLQQARSWITNGLFLCLSAIGVLYEGVSMTLPGGWMNQGEGSSAPLRRIALELHLPLTSLVPSVLPRNHDNQVLPVVLWLLLLGGLTLGVILLVQRRSGKI